MNIKKILALFLLFLSGFIAGVFFKGANFTKDFLDGPPIILEPNSPLTE